LGWGAKGLAVHQCARVTPDHGGDDGCAPAVAAPSARPGDTPEWVTYSRSSTISPRQARNILVRLADTSPKGVKNGPRVPLAPPSRASRRVLTWVEAELDGEDATEAAILSAAFGATERGA
jgi:hypothetical protein